METNNLHLEYKRNYYPNGQLWEEGGCKNGKQVGAWKQWYENGQLMAESKYRDGKREGLWKQWTEDGTPKSDTL